MDALLLFKTYLLLAEMVSIPLAFYLERKRKQRLPQSLPYTWGFFIGCTSLAFAPIALFFLYVIFSSIRGSAFLFICFLWATFLSGAGFYLIKRHKWAWVVGTILSLNPILWVVNGLYQRNRWAEFTTKR